MMQISMELLRSTSLTTPMPNTYTSTSLPGTAMVINTASKFHTAKADME